MPAQLTAASQSELLINMTGMGRGRLWVNGQEVGRYYLQPRNDGSQCPLGLKGCATQTYYHIPTAWLTATGNLLTIFESVGNAAARPREYIQPVPTQVRLAISSMGAPPASVDPFKVVSCVF